MRRLLALLLVALLALQSGWAMGSTVNLLADPEHAALHWHETSHHHHEDGSFHLDDSNESVQHVLSDHLNVPAAVPASSAQDLTPPAAAVPSGLHDSLAPHPFLEGPLRPPRRRS